MSEERIRKVFVASVIVLLAIVVAVTWLFSRFGEKVEQNMAKKFNDQQLILAHHIKNHIEDRFNVVEKQLGTLTREHDVINISRWITEKGWEKIEGTAADFYFSHIGPLLATNRYYLRFAITDISGAPVFYAENHDGNARLVHKGEPDPELKADFLIGSGTYQPGKINFSHLREVELVSDDKKTSYEVMDASIALERNGSTVGWLAVSVDMDMIIRLIEGVRNDESGHRWIFNDAGKLIYCSWVMSQEYHELEIKAMMNSKPGMFEILNPHQDDRRDLLSYVPLVIGDNKWNLVVETGFEEVSGIVHNLHQLRTITIFFLMLITMVGGFALYRSMLGRLVAEEKGLLVDKLTASEEKFRLLFELAPDPIFVLDRNRNIVSFNTGAVDTLKYSHLKMSGSPIEKFIPEKDAFVKEMDALVSNGGSRSWEHTVTDSHGNKLYFKNTTAVIKTDGGEVSFYQTYLYNLTEIKNFEFKLRQEKESLDKIVSSLGAGLAVFDENLQLQWHNDLYQELCENADLPSHCCLRNEHMRDNKEWKCSVKRAFEKGVMQSEDMKFTSLDGEANYFHITVTPIKDSQGKTIRVIELLTDITESKNLEFQLSQSDKLASLGELAAGVAHELNNPMTGIIGYSEFLMTELKDKNAAKDAERIHREAIRCSKIIENLLTFSRRQEQQRVPVLINDVINSTVEMVAYEFNVNNVLIEKDYDPDLKMVVGDRHELQQVFLNILNNAFYFLKEMKPPKDIWIVTRSVKNSVRVTIENNGPKIKEKSMNKLFDPFFTTKDVGKGTGLGLSISHGIIKSHEGKITVSNTELGVMFTITLPCAKKTASP